MNRHYLKSALSKIYPSIIHSDPNEKRASVGILVNQYAEVLYIKRARNERDRWSGHMAFPGGKRLLVLNLGISKKLISSVAVEKFEKRLVLL